MIRHAWMLEVSRRSIGAEKRRTTNLAAVTAVLLATTLVLAGCNSSALAPPVITSLNPSSATAGRPSFTLKVIGTGFRSTDVVLWNGAALATQPVSSTELDALVPGTLIQSAVKTAAVMRPASTPRPLLTPEQTTGPTTAEVTVFRKPPGSTTSNPMTFTITPSGTTPDFSISAAPSSQSVTTGGSTTYTVTVGALNGFTGTVDLTVGGLPTGATASVSPTSVAGSGTSTLTVSTASSTPAGSYTLTVTGTSGTLIHSATVTLVVSASPVLAITKTHTGNATQGQTGFSFNIVVSNSGTGSTSGTVTVMESPSSGITITAMSGTAWSCAPASCTRSDALAAASTYPTITVTATFAANASAKESNTGTVSGGGAAGTVSATDIVTVAPSVPAVTFTDLTMGDKDSGFFVSTSHDPYVAFTSSATNLVTGDTNGNPDVFVACVVAGTTANCPAPISRVSLNSSSGQIAGGTILDPTGSGSNASPISSDGRFVAFVSSDSNVVTPATPASVTEIYLRDTCLGAASCTPSTTLISATASGVAAAQFSNSPAMSSTGRIIAFTSGDFNLAPPASGQQVYARDTCFGAPVGCTIKVVLISADNSGTQGNQPSSNASANDDGRFIAFSSSANSLVPTSSPISMDIFLRDTCIGATGTCTPSTTLVSASQSGGPGNSFSQNPSISGDGRFVVFASQSSNLVPGGNTAAGHPDVFLRDTCGGTNGLVTGCTPKTTRVSQAISGTFSDGASITTPSGRSISIDGRFIAFASLASNLLPAPSTAGQVYVLDTCVGAVVSCQQALHKVSVDAKGNELGSVVTWTAYALSGDGHSIAFTALTGTAPNQIANVFIAPTGF